MPLYDAINPHCIAVAAKCDLTLAHMLHFLECFFLDFNHIYGFGTPGKHLYWEQRRIPDNMAPTAAQAYCEQLWQGNAYGLVATDPQNSLWMKKKIRPIVPRRMEKKNVFLLLSSLQQWLNKG